jgi:hypothetical protein
MPQSGNNQNVLLKQPGDFSNARLPIPDRMLRREPPVSGGSRAKKSPTEPKLRKTEQEPGRALPARPVFCATRALSRQMGDAFGADRCR